MSSTLTTLYANQVFHTYITYHDKSCFMIYAHTNTRSLMLSSIIVVQTVGRKNIISKWNFDRVYFITAFIVGIHVSVAMNLSFFCLLRNVENLVIFFTKSIYVIQVTSQCHEISMSMVFFILESRYIPSLPSNLCSYNQYHHLGTSSFYIHTCIHILIIYLWCIMKIIF